MRLRAWFPERATHPAAGNIHMARAGLDLWHRVSAPNLMWINASVRGAVLIRSDVTTGEIGMQTRGDADGRRASITAFFISPAGLMLLVMLAVAGMYLWMEHRAHLLGALLWLPLLACPLMHLFMHHGHGRHQKQGSASPPDAGAP